MDDEKRAETGRELSRAFQKVVEEEIPEDMQRLLDELK